MLEDARFLCRYCLNNRDYFTSEQAHQLRSDSQTMHLFAYREPMNRFNKTSLKIINNAMNPVAKLRPVYTKTSNPNIRSNSKHFRNKDGDSIEPTLIARGCKVELKGRNISPQLGLYNGAMGLVIDIVYNSNESPNSGHLPKYVLVQFPNYTGPQFLSSIPNVIPIVPISSVCPWHCCSVKFIPLQLCYGKTIHTFQGQNAGPVDPTQQHNSIQRIIVDIGSRQFEGRNPGLTYTALSRATTLGKSDDVSTSALFFDGDYIISPDRFADVATNTNTNKPYSLVDLRNKWVGLLKENTIKSGLSSQQQQDTFHWADSFSPTNDDILQFFDLFNNHSYFPHS